MNNIVSIMMECTEFSDIQIFCIILAVDEMSQLPLVKQGLQMLNDRIPQARRGGNETFTPPLVVPRKKGPARNYFLFQKVSSISILY